MNANEWQPMKTAPRNATDVRLKLKNGETVIGHWASDLSGEDQPPFEGWFEKKPHLNCFTEVKPFAWRSI